MSDDAPARLAACTAVIAAYFDEQSEALLAAAREPLLVAARDAPDRDEEDRLVSVLEEVEALAPQVTGRFRDAMLAALGSEPHAAPSAGEDSAPDGGLSLVATAKVDDWLRLRGMLERQGERERALETELWERLAALAGVEPDPDGNPVSLQGACIAFQAAMQAYAPGRDARAALYDAFETTVAGHLDRLAARVAETLDEDAAALPAPAEASGTAAPGRGDAEQVDPARVLGAMASVQRREVAAPPAGLDDLEARLLEAIAPAGAQASLDDGERRTVAAVSRLVRAIVGDPDVDPGVQRRLSHLAPPLLMLALQDEGYLEAEIAAARHDPVTGLLDRSAFRARLEAAMRNGGGAAVCLLDVDDFAQHRLRLGHQGGGRLLRALANLLRHQAGPRNVAARLRGDEFAVLLPGAKPGAGRRFADRYLASLSAARFVFGAEQVELHASVGVVEADAAFASSGELMRAADAARNRAKADGGGCVRIADGD